MRTIGIAVAVAALIAPTMTSAQTYYARQRVAGVRPAANTGPKVGDRDGVWVLCAAPGQYCKPTTHNFGRVRFGKDQYGNYYISYGSFSGSGYLCNPGNWEDQTVYSSAGKFCWYESQ